MVQGSESTEVLDRESRRNSVQRPRRYRSIAAKVSIFMGLLVCWVIVVAVGLENNQRLLGMGKPAAVVCVVALVAGGIAKFVTKFLVKPLGVLEEGIRNLEKGQLRTIRPARTGDEIEYLGESFNRMVAALSTYRAAVHRSKEVLERRILQRTEELERALTASVSANRAKSDFVANMSHELRTPMSGVIGMLELLSESELNREQRDYLVTARDSAHSLLALVNDLLDLSKIEAGKMVLEEIPFELRQLVRESVRGSLAAAAAKGLTLDLEVDTETPRGVTGDPLRLRQVLVNLINNAVKFTSEGGVWVRVWGEVGNGEPESYKLRISVIDSGAGIAEGKLEAIFEKFTQADTSISRRHGGTGLGLAITRSLVELQGGRVWAESTVGEGSRFHVELPCRPASLLAEPKPAGGEGDRQPAGAERGRILLVEDNSVNQKVVVAMMKKRGYEVDVAGDGMSAIEALERRSYGLVLMDVQMPGLDGLETTRRIRRDDRFTRLPIVAMTAHAMSGDKERCLEAGMDAYLAKPVDQRNLIRVVNELLAGVAQEAGSGEERAGPGRVATLTEAEPEIATQMVKLFLQLAPERMEKMKESMENRDSEALRRYSRRLVCAAQSIAAGEVMKSAEEVHKAGVTEDWGRAETGLAALEAQLWQLNAPALEEERLEI
ncbi:MAG: hybrid sensor histidine kinase/response regulator [Candidatus Solibacter sp.]|nr:hybrid sensor histidine kinase/response regulator [Candidatus Solibacter sp.]